MVVQAMENITDTHLSKHYNQVVYDAIMKCNVSGHVLESTPHYDNMRIYYASINNLFMTTFFLFNTIKVGKDKDKILSTYLSTIMKEIKLDMKSMRKEAQYRNAEFFDEVTEQCHKVRMFIMYGLQKRNMLVRTSDIEPRGQDSIAFWDKKAIFQKGGIKFKKKEE